MNTLKLRYISVLFILFFYGSSFSQFVENRGQLVDFNQNLVSQVEYFYGCQNTAIYFERDRVVYSFITPDEINESLYDGKTELLDSLKENRMATYSRMDMLFLGSNSDLQIQSGKRTQGDIHYYLNKRNGIRNVGSYETVIYKNLYSGIDVKFYQHESGLKYDFILHQGAKIEDIKIKFLGAESVKLEEGRLIIETKHRKLVESIPLSFIDEDKNKEVEVNYLLDDEGVLHFTTNAVDFASLTIDPVMEWATYFNNTSATTASLDYCSSHLDASGNFYLYGQVYSAANNYPVVNPGSAYTAVYNASSDLYIAKFDATRALVWATYLGGSSGDNSYGSEPITSNGNTLHVVGERISTGTPFTNGGGYYDATANRVFWARFNLSTGALQHLTSLGSGYDPSVAVGSSGQVAVIMDAYGSSNPPIMSRSGAYNQATNGGGKDMYLFLTNASYSQIWGTFLGGPATQENFMCRFDNNDNLFFIGESSWSTSSSTIANEHITTLAGAYNDNSHNGGTDVLLGKFTSTGALVWNTFYGGDISDARQGQQGGYAKILIDPTTQELSMFWNTTSTNLPTMDAGGGAYYKTVPTHPSFDGNGSFWNYAAYFARFTSAGALSHASYYYNSTDGDLIHDVAFGGCNKLYIIGRSDPTTFSPITLPGGFNLATGGQVNLIQMDRSSLNAEWLSQLAIDDGYGPTIDGRPDNPRIYAASEGYGTSSTMVDPGGGAYYNASNINGTSANLMIWQLHPTLSPNISGNANICSGQTTTLTASGGSGTYEWFSQASGGSVIFTGPVFTTGALNSDTTFYVRSADGLCSSARVSYSINVNTSEDPSFSYTQASYCSSASDPTPTITGVTGGTFSALPSGLSINSGTGTIDLSASTPNAYTITYTTGGTCPGSTTFNLSVQAPPVGTFNYSGSPYCGTGNASVTFTGGGVAGTFTSTAGLSINSSTGEVDLAASTPNTYTVTNTIAAGTCPQVVETTSITIQTAESAAFSYSSANYCLNSTDETPTITGVAGGTFSVLPAGLVINPSTGEVDFSASSVNNYTITYTTGGTCPGSETFDLSIQAPPVATFNYSGSPYCAVGTASVTFTGGGVAGTFTSTAGIIINSTTGEVNLSASTPNTYTVTNTIAAGACPQVVETATITIQTLEDATFNYPDANYCLSSANETPTITGVTGGTFSVLPAGLDIDPLTGEIDFSNSSANSYVITYQTGGTCPGQEATSINLEAPPVGTFNYTASPYCAIGTASVTFTGGGVAGTFSSTPGLSINSATGEIDLAASTPNTYTVTNTIAAGVCPQVVETASVTIQAIDDATFSYSSASYCLNNGNVAPTISGTTGGTFSVLPTGLDINTSTGEIDFSNSSAGNYTITYATGGACPDSETFDLTVLDAPTTPSLVTSTATVCVGEEITISVTSPQAGITYNIYDAASGGNLIGTAPYTFSPSTSDSYFIEAENGSGCASSPVEFQFTVNPLPGITSNGDRTICPGEDATLSVIASGTITWSNGGAGNFIIVSPTTTTTYTATVVGANSCQNSVDVTVTVVNTGSIVAVDDYATVASGDSINIPVLSNDIGGMMPLINVNPTSGTATVESSDASILYQSNAGASGTDQFTYIICSDVCTAFCDTATVYITILNDDIDTVEIDFVIPEGFSPNADGINDVFEIPNLYLYPNTQVVIFNRWGAKVYESDNYQNDWDGRSQNGLNVGGDELPEGTFYYLITMGGDIEDGISGEVFKGYLYLKR